MKFFKLAGTTKGTTGSHRELSAISQCHSWIHICSRDNDGDDYGDDDQDGTNNDDDDAGDADHDDDVDDDDDGDVDD